MKKTNIIPAACFGYFDSNFSDCLNCRCSESCLNATKSPEVEEVRAIEKIRHSQIDELIKKYKTKGSVEKTVQKFEKQTLFPDE